MKNTLIILSATLLLVACKKTNPVMPNDVPDETKPTSDLLYYVAGQAPVAVNAFGQIYKYDGATETQVSSGLHLYSACHINASKTKIVCLRAYNTDLTKKELVVMNADGNNETVIVPFANSLLWNNLNSAQWCPDGNNIILVANGRIAIIKSDGTGGRFISKILFSGPNAFMYDCASPVISPDGNRIAYVRRPVCDSELVVIDNVSQKLPINTELYVATLNSGMDSLYNEKRLTNNGYNLRELSPSWSPDSKRLAYCQAPNDYNTSKIISCDYTGNGVKLLLNDGNDNVFTKWSTDGSRIYFQAYNFSSLEGSLCSCDATDGYGVKIILKGTVSKQYKQFCNLKN